MDNDPSRMADHNKSCKQKLTGQASFIRFQVGNRVKVRHNEQTGTIVAIVGNNPAFRYFTGHIYNPLHKQTCAYVRYDDQTGYENALCPNGEAVLPCDLELIVPKGVAALTAELVTEMA